MTCRATELTMPIVTEFCRPKGLPAARTSSPCRSAPESPSFSAGHPLTGDFQHGDVGLPVEPDQFAHRRVCPAGLRIDVYRLSGFRSGIST